MKATYVEILEEKITDYGNPGTEAPVRIKVGREIFKDPITDDGMKKSATGLLQVYRLKGAHGVSDYVLKDKVSWEEESQGELRTLYKDGTFYDVTTLSYIREILKKFNN